MVALWWAAIDDGAVAVACLMIMAMINTIIVIIIMVRLMVDIMHGCTITDYGVDQVADATVYNTQHMNELIYLWHTTGDADDNESMI